MKEQIKTQTKAKLDMNEKIDFMLKKAESTSDLIAEKKSNAIK